MLVALTGDTREQKPQSPGVQTLRSSPDCQTARLDGTGPETSSLLTPPASVWEGFPKPPLALIIH